MSTTQVLIVAVTVVVVVAIAAVTLWRVHADELAAAALRGRDEAGALQACAERDSAALAVAESRRALGPADGARVGVHLGQHLIQGKRVLRDDADADGWIALDDAELLEGARATPLGGRQWLREAQWIQEL